MTNNTINVPRELLADLLGNDHDKRIMAERHLLAMLANAPSPAGVDGLKRYEVFPYLDDEVAEIDICESDDGSFVKYEDAQAIIDGLRGEVAQLQSMLATVSKAGIRIRTERDQQAQRIGELEGLLREAYKYPLNHACETVDFTAQDLCERIDAALSDGKEGE